MGEISWWPLNVKVSESASKSKGWGDFMLSNVWLLGVAGGCWGLLGVAGLKMFDFPFLL